jgi:uncharacterized YccA/Bax inhibitor family protein
MAYKTGNPALTEKTFKGLAQTGSGTMSLEGTANKTLLLLVICVASAFYGWGLVPKDINAPITNLGLFVLVGLPLIAFVLAIILIFKPKTSPVLAPLYAALEGTALGALSAIFEYEYTGIVRSAVSLTLAVFLAMLLIYKMRLIRATENFKLGVVSATGGIALYYLFNLFYSLGTGKSLPLIWDNGPLGIAFSVIVIIIAALNLVLDFDFIESGVRDKAPKYMEWYGGFGLLVTLIWLYLEILRLLSKLRSR